MSRVSINKDLVPLLLNNLCLRFLPVNGRTLLLSFQGREHLSHILQHHILVLPSLLQVRQLVSFICLHKKFEGNLWQEVGRLHLLEQIRGSLEHLLMSKMDHLLKLVNSQSELLDLVRYFCGEQNLSFFKFLLKGYK